MSNQIQFQSFDFNSSAVRVIQEPNQETWFCGTDVCSILGYINAPDALKKHCKEAGIAKRYISYPSGRKEAIFINEPNLYRLIIKSRKPEAEKFEAWVFEEVLPQLRKTGKYQVQQQLTLPEPEPEKSVIVDISAGEIHSLVWLLLSHRNMNTLLGDLTEPLRAIGSNLAPMVHSQHHEYKWLINACNPLLKRLIKPFKETNRMEYERIKHRLDLDNTALISR